MSAFIASLSPLQVARELPPPFDRDEQAFAMHEKRELLWPYELRLGRRRPAGNQRLQAAWDEGLGDPDPEQRGEPEVGAATSARVRARIA
jgi:hypothetical protein